MDIDRILDIERRTGVKSSDIDDFTRKASEVEAAIKGLLDGSLSPDQIKIEGIETEEEKKANEERRLRIQQEQLEKALKLAAQRKQEEKERWWAGVDLFAKKQKSNASVDDLEADAVVSTQQRYSMDYSRWDVWVPNDPATMHERETLRSEEEKKQNEAFEKANPEFCQEFLADQAAREKAIKKKETSADVARLKGNRHYQRKEYDLALANYMEALKLMPYDIKTLANIAQVHIKQNNLEDAMEFLSRTLYMDPTHVKALSRKAVVLDAWSRFEEALAAAREALRLEPQNNDLVVQVRDLESIVKENKDEAQLSAVLGSSQKADKIEYSNATEASIAPKSAHVDTCEPIKAENKEADRKPHENSSPSQQCNSPTDTEIAAELLSYLVHCFSDEFLTSFPDACMIPLPTGKPSLSERARLLQHAIQTQDANSSNNGKLARELLKHQPMLKIYLRKSELLQTYLLPLAKFVLEVLCADSFDISGLPASSISVISQLLNLLADAARGERTSKMLVMDSQLLSVVSNRLLTVSWILNAHEILLAALSVIKVCCEDDVCPKSQKLCHSNRALFARAAAIVGELSTYIAECNLADQSVDAVVDVINESCLLIRSYPTSDFGKALLQVDGADIGSAVFALGTSLFSIVSKLKDIRSCKKENITVSTICEDDVIENIIAALLFMSQVDTMRKYYGITIPPPTTVYASKTLQKSKSSSITISAVTALCDLMRYNAAHSVNCVAIIMNALLESENVVKMEVEKSDICSVALSAVAAKHSSQSAVQSNEESDLLRNRYSGLLARMANTEVVGKMLSVENNFRILCKEFSWAVHQRSAAGITSQQSKWRNEEVGHLVRLIAGLPKPVETTCEVALSENLFSNLFSLLPMPRQELGEVTPSSVILMPTDMPAPLLVGNAARILLQFADNAACSGAIFSVNEGNRSKVQLTVEKLICCMACCTDIRVRKNIAIVLAKGCRIPSVREKVQHFRGLQMIVELQDKIM